MWACQAALIRQVYEDKHGKSLAKTIMRKFSGDVEDALLALLYDPIENYARALKKAFHGLGTDEVSASGSESSRGLFVMRAIDPIGWFGPMETDV